MSRKVFNLACACAVVLCAAASARADLRIKQRTTMQGQTYESNVAIKGQRQRTEQQFGPTKNVSILQCDARRMLNISEATRKYTVTSFVAESADAANTTAAPARPAPAGAARRGGVVTYAITTTDTGERKQMFGFTARHIKTVMKSEPSPDACNTEPFHYEADGWYIDFEFNFDCLNNQQAATPSYGGAQPECQDRVRYRRTGAAKLGYPVQVTTSFFKNGSVQFTQTTEVVELSRATLDAALFDVPAGYTEARDARELYDASATAAAMQSQARDDDDDSSASGGSTPVNSGTLSASPVGAKRAGVVRVGVIPPSNKTDKQVGIDQLRAQLVAALTGGNVEAVALEAGSPGGLEAEARAKECDFLLYTDIVSVKQSAASKIGGFLGRATGASDAKPKHEARVEFSLVAAGSSAPLLESNATAKEDGTADAAVASALRREAQLVAAKVRK